MLTIASSDSGGGAGIQADLKAFARCGAHGMSAVVALTAQNTLGVTSIAEQSAGFVRDQIRTVLDDIGADAAKTGMLFSSAIIEAVADELAGRRLPLVVDPVMVASSGSRLLLPDAVATLTGRLFPLATVVTPNLPEAQALTGLDTEDRAALAERLVAMGAGAALVTGGHGANPADHLFDGRTHLSIPVARHDIAATHGAGCTHSAALAAGLAAGLSLPDAARQAAAVAGDAVAHGLVGIGGGDGPVHVLHALREASAPAPAAHPATTLRLAAGHGRRLRTRGDHDRARYVPYMARSIVRRRGGPGRETGLAGGIEILVSPVTSGYSRSLGSLQQASSSAAYCRGHKR